MGVPWEQRERCATPLGQEPVDVPQTTAKTPAKVDDTPQAPPLACHDFSAFRTTWAPAFGRFLTLNLSEAQAVRFFLFFVFFCQHPTAYNRIRSGPSYFLSFFSSNPAGLLKLHILHGTIMLTSLQDHSTRHFPCAGTSLASSPLHVMEWRGECT